MMEKLAGVWRAVAGRHGRHLGADARVDLVAAVAALEGAREWRVFAKRLGDRLALAGAESLENLSLRGPVPRRLPPHERRVAGETLLRRAPALSNFTPDVLVRVKHETRTTLSYAGLVKRAVWTGFAQPGALATVQWKKLAESLYGVPFYRRLQRNRDSQRG